ncbi:hypothetical protein DFH09DRAFT_1459598 [Mycena vulgaris]|nr:hypothetical protein DFH09DRAFT_1459598 [Mycena vulgaris]
MDPIAPASQSPPPMFPPAASIPPTIARPVYTPPMYDYHGLPFSMLPPDVQSFLASHGLDNLAQYTAEHVAAVRHTLADALVLTTADLCTAIAYTNIRYNIHLYVDGLPPTHPAPRALVAQLHLSLLPQLAARLTAHLRLADALVWADVTARAGGPHALDTPAALCYRALQTQPPIELVNDELVRRYTSAVGLQTLGWRTAAQGGMLYRQGFHAETDEEADAEPAPAYVESPLDQRVKEALTPEPAPAPAEAPLPPSPAPPPRRPDTPIPRSASAAPPESPRAPPPRPRTPARAAHSPSQSPRRRTRTVPLPAAVRATPFSPPPSPRPNPQRARAMFNSLPNRLGPLVWADERALLARLALMD